MRPALCMMAALSASSLPVLLPFFPERLHGQGPIIHRESLAAPAAAPVTVDDLLALERVEGVVPSPDGNWFAITIIRGRTAGEIFGHENLFGLTRADIWILPSDGGAPRNMTRGHLDGGGYWSPVWSPDSRRLAVISTAGGDNIRPYVIDVGTGEVRRLTERGLDLDLNAGASELLTRNPFFWSGSTHIVCSLLSPGELARAFVRRSPVFASLATEAWEVAAAGVDATADVLEAGIEVGPENRPNRDLVSIDVTTGRAEVLLSAQARSVTPSPDGMRFAVITATSAILPSRTASLNYPSYAAGGAITRMHGELAILTLGPEPQATRIAGVFDPEAYVAGRTPKWSDDGRSLVIIGKEQPHSGAAATAFLVDAERARANRIDFGTGSVRGTYLLRRTLLVADGNGWWAIDSLDGSSAPRPVGQALPEVPDSFLALNQDEVLVSLVAGDLWMINHRSGGVEKLTSEFGPYIERVIWQSSFALEAGLAGRGKGSVHRQLLVSTRGAEGSDLHLLMLADSVVSQRVSPPHPDARFAAGGTTGSAIFVMEGSAGTVLWSGDISGASVFERRLVLNEHLAGRVKGASRTITYRNADGQHFYAALLLPVHYEEGETYPLVTHVYPGVVIPKSGYRADRIYTPSPQHSLTLFASMGFAVLYPSIPLPAGPEAIDPLMEIAGNVIPAVDEVIRLGIADPDRLALYGHSYGGYAAISLLTQTRRFDVAVASGGFSDLLSYYSQFEITHRYFPFAHELEQLNMAEWEREDATIRMRSLPWDDHLRYLRNSPLSYLQRIETPLMMIHGDLDGAPMSQAEAVFMGLYRMGKRARLVRYWGEGHTLDSPANIRDNWQRISDWLSEHLHQSRPGG